MKHFACGDLVPGCSATFSGATTEDILDQVVRHARADHGLTTFRPELVDGVRGAVRTVAV